MISSLYDCFKHWSKSGSVYIISDTHFADHDCKFMDPNWIEPQEQLDILNKMCHKNDTLIILGDVGSLDWAKQIKAYKVLIKGNHDDGLKKYQEVFDEVYEGPLFISEKILLSHEPIMGLNFCMNIHGHDHGNNNVSPYHMNLAANVCGYRPVSLGKLIKNGLTAHIPSIHRITIDRAAQRKSEK